MEEKKSKHSYGKRIIKLAIVLVVFLILTNPSILPILPYSVREALYMAWSGIFGDIGKISSIIRINWVSLFQIVAIILMMSILYSVAKLILGKIKPKTGRAQSILSMINSVIMYGAVLVTIIWCLNAIGVNMSTIFASIGIIALIVGFAAESLIEDLIIGIFLTFEDEFNIGDIIEYDGFRGTVISIGMRVTCIQNAGGNIKIVNNSDIRSVLNRSKAKSFAVCDVPISYAANLEEAEKVVGEILKSLPEKYPEVFSVAPTYTGVQELAASSVNLRVTAEVDDADIFKAGRLINREIKIGMDQANLEIPFTQIVVHQE